MTCQYSGCNVPESECSGECIQSYKNAMVDAEMASQKAMSQQIGIMNELLDAKSKIAELREENERLKGQYKEFAANGYADIADRKRLNERIVTLEAQLADEKLHVKQLEKGFDKFQAQLAALQGGATEAVAEIVGAELVWKQGGMLQLPPGTKLYTQAPAIKQQVADGLLVQFIERMNRHRRSNVWMYDKAIEILRELLTTQSVSANQPDGGKVPPGYAVVQSGWIQMVVNALRRDAEDGKVSRGEMVDELERAMLASAPAIQPQAAAPAVVPEWQPIETSPKDGTRIWVCRKGSARFEAWWELGTWRWSGGFLELHDEMRLGPTHWVPLATNQAGGV